MIELPVVEEHPWTATHQAALGAALSREPIVMQWLKSRQAEHVIKEVTTPVLDVDPQRFQVLHAYSKGELGILMSLIEEASKCQALPTSD